MTRTKRNEWCSPTYINTDLFPIFETCTIDVLIICVHALVQELSSSNVSQFRHLLFDEKKSAILKIRCTIIIDTLQHSAIYSILTLF